MNLTARDALSIAAYAALLILFYILTAPARILSLFIAPLATGFIAGLVEGERGAVNAAIATLVVWIVSAAAAAIATGLALPSPGKLGIVKGVEIVIPLITAAILVIDTLLSASLAYLGGWLAVRIRRG